MDADDPRHGTYAGYVAHGKLDSLACIACARAATRYRKQRRLEAHRGQPREVPLGQRAWRTINDTTPEHLARQGVPLSTIFRLRKLGPEARVRRHTRDRILATNLPTPIGIQRRLRALSALGWSMRALAAEMGDTYADNLRTLLAREEVNYVREPMATKIAATYERIVMQPAPNHRGSSRARNRANREGWPPPLAYGDIDDPSETPTEWEYQPATRAELLQDLVHDGNNISQACRRLDVSRSSLQAWCARNSLSDAYLTLTSRERRAGNKYAKEVA